MKIKIESYNYCGWCSLTLNKCPYISDANSYCNKYNKSLLTGYATNAWSGRDEFYVERCNECKSNINN